MEICYDSVIDTASSSSAPMVKEKNIETERATADKMKLRLYQSDSLDVGNLLSLLAGSEENLEYFIGLWNAVKSQGDEKELNNFSCDPRDERKRNRVLNWKPTVRLSFDCPDCSVMEQTDNFAFESNFVVKQTVLSEDHQQEGTNGFADTIAPGDGDKKKFHCGEHGCGAVLESLARYEAHYHHCHNYVCGTCRRSFVSNFFLDIHLQENHDSYFAALCSRIDMYKCLVESCTEKFRTSELRKDHLVTVHKFPASFSFHQPIKDKRLPAGPPHPVVNPSGMETSDHLPVPPTGSTSMDVECAPTSSASKSKSKNSNAQGASSGGKRVPATVCFGRGSQRAFQPGRGQGRRGRGGKWYQTATAMEANTAVDIEAVDMNDLKEALT